jgi:hypothetical protein
MTSTVVVAIRQLERILRMRRCQSHGEVGGVQYMLLNHVLQYHKRGNMRLRVASKNTANLQVMHRLPLGTLAYTLANARTTESHLWTLEH